jgi:predicted RNA-binding Zn-ribbon protein involved in translation (DUF1610 family)
MVIKQVYLKYIKIFKDGYKRRLMKLPEFRPPATGDKAIFVCKKCGRRFMAVIRIVPFQVKCPECGSLKVERDKKVSY